MKIAVWYNLPSGGAKRALYDHLVGLKALGHEIEIWRPPVREQKYLDLRTIATEHEVPLAFEERDSWFYPTKILRWANRVDRLVSSLTTHAKECARQIRKGDFDILFANTDVIFHAPHIGRYLDMPKVLYIQEPNRPLYEALPRLPWLLAPPSEAGGFLKQTRRRGRAFIENRNSRILATEEVENARHYDRILVNSRFSRESVLRAYGVNAHVCYLGIDPGLFQNLHLPREPFVMCVGTIFPAKNPDLLIRGVGCLPKEIRPPLVWPYNSGDTVYLGQMEALARSLDVDFQPMKLVPDERLVELLNRATAFVYAPRLEPFGLAPLEANACGTPVVAVAEGGVRETIQPGLNGILVDHDPSSVAEGIRSLLDDPGLARRLGDAGEGYVRKEWSVEAAAKRLERHLIEVLEAKRQA